MNVLNNVVISLGNSCVLEYANFSVLSQLGLEIINKKELDGRPSYNIHTY